MSALGAGAAMPAEEEQRDADDELAGVRAMPSRSDLMGAGALAVVGAAACIVGLTVVVDARRTDAAVWQAILLAGLVCAAVSAGLVLVAVLRRGAKLRTLDALSYDLADAVERIDARDVGEGRAHAIGQRGRLLRRLALEAGDARRADAISGLLSRLDARVNELEGGSGADRSMPSR